MQEIKLGEANVVLAGGAESMSQAPYAVRNVRWGSPLGVDLKVCRKLQCSVSDRYMYIVGTVFCYCLASCSQP